MADFSPSGVPGLPNLTGLALDGKDHRYLGMLNGWMDEAVREGDLLNEADPNYPHIAEGMAYVSGDQAQVGPLPQYMEPVQLNLCRQAMQTHVSAITDVKPVAGWRSENPKYQFSADLLNKLTVAWWVSELADLQYGEAIKYAWACGTGDMEIAWDPTLPGGGNHVLLARDPRDTLPIRPGRQRSVQTWGGMILRDIWTVNALRAKYPLHAPYIKEAHSGILSMVKGLFLTRRADLQTPADPLATLGMPKRSGPPRPGEAVLYRMFLDDRTRNNTSRPVVMGDPGTNWAYTVNPGELLYPGKRLVIRINEDLVVYDGPNPYWHGKYPITRLMLWNLPWFFLGVSALRDLKPLQNAINDTINQHRLGVRRWVEQSAVINSSTLGAAASHTLDLRKPGQKLKAKGTVVNIDQLVKPIEGPNPQVLALNSEMLDKLIVQFERLSGMANLQQLMQLRQMPGADTIEKYYEAMTPELRYEGRMAEAFLREASQQILFNTFQFMDAQRRVHLLGPGAVALEDFDFDPAQMVPAEEAMITQVDPATGMPVQVPNPNYDPQFDASKPRAERAKAMARLLTFIVAPNSLMGMSAQEEKMTDFQLARIGYMDFWSLMERLERPNVGSPPAIPLPALKVPQDPNELLLALAEGRLIPDPSRPGMFLEIREPMTITERLMAQQILGIGMTSNPAGRKASGGSEPKLEEKSDGNGGSRTTITESSGTRNA